MTKIPLNIRVEAVDLEHWLQDAKAAGLSLSEWIRRNLNDREVLVVDPTGSRETFAIPAIRTPRPPTRRKSPHKLSTKPLPSSRIPPIQMSLVPDGMCKHHKAPGSLCYKCDPKMGYPIIPSPPTNAA